MNLYLGSPEQRKEEVDNGYDISTKGEQLVKLFRFVELLFPVPDESSIYPNGHKQTT